MGKKSIKRICAFTLAAVITATSVIPAAPQSVYAASYVDDGNPFRQNAALNKPVTVTYDNGKVDERADVARLVDGDHTGMEGTNNYWESETLTDNAGNRIDREAEIVIDMEQANWIDHIALYWRQAAPAKEYEIYVSADNAAWKSVGIATSAPGSWENENAKADYTFSPQYARYVKVVCKTPTAYGVYTLREIEVYTIGGLDQELETFYARGKAVAASAEVDGMAADKINDGDMGTRWSSGEVTGGDTDSEKPWIYIDLGEAKPVNQVKINWEGAYASDYTIEVSADEKITDDTQWTLVGAYSIDKAGEQTHDFQDISARYVKVSGTPMNSVWGISIYEMEVNCIRTAILPEQIYLSRTEDYVFDEAGDTLQIYAQVLPANAGDADQVSWETSDPDVAVVENGLVTAIGNGTATITASAGDDISASIKVVLAQKLDTPADVTAEQAADTSQIHVSWSRVPGTGVSYEIYRVVDGVQETSLIEADTNSYTDTAVEAGYAYSYMVRAVCKNENEYTAIGEWSKISDELTIPLGVDAVTLDQSQVELEITAGAESKPGIKLTENVLPAKATNKAVVWTSGNDRVATVDALGNVQAVATGRTVITVTTEDNGRTAECEVIVKEQLAAPEVTAEKTGDQAVTLTWQAVANAGSYQIFRAEGKEGSYETLAVDADKIEIADGKVSYTDTIDEDAIGNVYSYKVAALPVKDSYYTRSNDSAETAKIQIGQQSPFGINVAEGAAATADSDNGRGPEYMTDGSTNKVIGGWWESAKKYKTEDSREEYGGNEPVEYPQNCTIDLGEDYEIDRIRIYWNNDVPAASYKILTASESDTKATVVKTYEERPVANGIDCVTDCILDKVETVRYITVEMNTAAAYGSYGIVEIEAYTQGTVEKEDNVLTGILLSQKQVQLKKGGKVDLYAQKLPANAADEVIWTSDNASVAVVSKGKVTGVGAGMATITAKAGSYEKSCAVVVTEKLAAAEGMTAELEESKEKSIIVRWEAVEHAASYQLYRTEAGESTAVLIAGDLTDTSYTDDKVTAGKTYSYQVVAANPEKGADIALYEDSDKSRASAKLTIPIHVTGITLNETETELTMEQGKDAPYVELKAAIEPSDAMIKDVTWKSADEGIAVVDANGVVTAVSVGTTTITATTKDEKSNASAECKVTVKEKLAAPEISASLTEEEEKINILVTGVSNADFYTLLRSVNGGDYAEVTDAVLTSGRLIYSDDDITKGNSYTYKVIAVSQTPEIYLTSEESVPTDTVAVPVHVTEIKLDQTQKTLTILPGEQMPATTLAAEIFPDNATVRDVVWESSDPDVAVVDADGIVTAVSVGTAAITVTAKDEKSPASASCRITVVQKLDEPKVTSVKAEDDTSITLYFGSIEHAGSYKIYRAVDAGELKEVNSAELTFADGIITYVDADLEKGKTYSYRVVAVPESEFYLESEQETEGLLIPVPVEKVALDKQTAELQVGKTLTLEKTVLPGHATVKEVTWSSSDEKVAVVKDGVVTAKAVGTATITVTAKDGGKTASCVITVTENLGAPVISAGKNGADVVITWNVIPNASGYDVYTSTDGKTYRKLGSTTALTYTEKNISSSMHYYKVIAKGSKYYIDSQYSNVVSIDNRELKVTKITLSQTAVSLNKGRTCTLAAAVTPGNATNTAVIWTSSNAKVAAVSQNGVVKAVGKGTATITATAADGSGQWASCKITVKIPATKVTLNTKKVYVVKGKTVSVKAVMNPSDSTDKITWISSNPKIASVKNGKITARKTGNVTITAKTTSGKKATLKVYVVKKATKATSIKLNKKKLSIKKGATYDLVATVKPATSTDIVKWKSSNKKVATVDAFGTVTGKKKGTATITATTSSGKKYTCKVTVKN